MTSPETATAAQQACLSRSATTRYSRAWLFSHSFVRVPFPLLQWSAAEARRSAMLVRSGELVSGPALAVLRQRLEAIYDAPVILTNSGRTALRGAFDVLGLPPGANVVVPALACPGGMIRPVLDAGVKAVLCDVDANYNLDPTALAKLLDKLPVDAVLAAHMAGCAADIVAIRQLCDAAGAVLIEDAAQSFGLMIGEQVAGSFGDLTILSFGPGKSLSATAGGALILGSRFADAAGRTRPLAAEAAADVRRRLRSARYGLSPCWRPWTLPFARAAAALGCRRAPAETASVMANADADMICALLDRQQELIAGRCRNSHALRSKLAAGPLVLPRDERHVYTKFLIRVADGDDVREIYNIERRLLVARIESEWFYPPVHLRGLPCETPLPLPNADRVWERIIALPNADWLGAAALDRVADAVLGRS